MAATQVTMCVCTFCVYCNLWPQLCFSYALWIQYLLLRSCLIRWLTSVKLICNTLKVMFYVILHRVWLESCNQTTITQLATDYMDHGIQVNFTIY